MPHHSRTACPPLSRPRANLFVPPLRPIARAAKLTIVLELLSRKEGATTGELMRATGWRRHSVRAMVSTVRRKRRLVITSHRTGSDTRYRLGGKAGPAPAHRPAAR